jgi:hypothetical protein
MAVRAGGVIVEQRAPHLSMLTHPRDVASLVVEAAEAI